MLSTQIIVLFEQENTMSYLQKQKVSHYHIATTTKHKSYGMNLVVTKHKLTFL